jgi:hypothetical protein
MVYNAVIKRGRTILHRLNAGEVTVTGTQQDLDAFLATYWPQQAPFAHEKLEAWETPLTLTVTRRYPYGIITTAQTSVERHEPDPVRELARQLGKDTSL